MTALKTPVVRTDLRPSPGEEDEEDDEDVVVEGPDESEAAPRENRALKRGFGFWRS